MEVKASQTTSSPSNAAQQVDQRFGDNIAGNQGLPAWLPVVGMVLLFVFGLVWLGKKGGK
jgi:hypothetical protein